MGTQDNIRNPNPVSTYDWKGMRTIRKDTEHQRRDR